MQFNYDEIADALYILIRKDKPHETNEVQEGVILDYNEDGFIVGVEILNFSQRNLDLNKFLKMKEEEIISSVVRT